MNQPLWDDQPWPPLPRLVGTVRADVCVVGLGGSGLAALDELAALGVNAIGLDAGPVGGGAAGRNGGFVLAGLAEFFHRTVARCGRDTAAALYRLTLDEIERQAREFPGMLRRPGSLRLAADAAERDDCRAHLAALGACGFPAEPYAGPEGEGILLPTDGVMQPLRRVRALAQRLRERRVLLYEHSPVRKMVPGTVATDGGVVLCGAVLVAVDGKLEVLFPELQPRARTARLQMLGTAPAPEVHFPRPCYWRYGYEYWQQQPDGSIALGGFRDHALEEEWTRQTEPTDLIQGLLEKFLREKLGVRAPVTHRWAAAVAYTPDALPVIEQVRANVWAVGAYNGTGNVVGALSARAAARRLCGEPAPWADLVARARRGGS
ncbi:MAG TPA: FAD-dependent oxidoreductase [Lacunisphaera sp.]|jgi:glycine/D-amino acid oxidase-like deaminating enzyme|nr:FAD-dependent oxidoreductase [Lacunisphaera sp.]